MFPYNFKVWACQPEKINVEWMGEIVTTVDVTKVIANVILEKDDGDWGPNSTFRYLKHGGTGAIWNGLYQKLLAKNFYFSKSVISIDAKKKEVTYSDSSSELYDALISTIPLSNLCRIVGFGMDGYTPTILKDKTWLYCPEDNCPFYHVSIFSNFAADTVPRPGEQWSLMCEIAESIDKLIDQSRVISIVEQGLKNTKLIDEQTKIISQFHMRLEYGYSTPFQGRDSLCLEISNEFEAHQIYSRGRFGSWKYEISNQDHSLMQGVEVIDHILFGTEEMTFTYSNIVNQNRDTTGRRPCKI